jgi:Spy/CpxP family protein refolding chaperone
VKCFRLLFAFVFLAALGWAQTAQPDTHAESYTSDDPIAQSLFPPELVMKYRQEINLDDGQSKALKEAIQNAQAKFLDLQWDAQAEAEKLAQLLNARPVDENAALAQVDRVLNREREIKRTQISLLVRIKNLLTDAQQNKLTELRHKPS